MIKYTYEGNEYTLDTLTYLKQQLFKIQAEAAILGHNIPNQDYFVQQLKALIKQEEFKQYLNQIEEL